MMTVIMSFDGGLCDGCKKIWCKRDARMKFYFVYHCVCDELLNSYNFLSKSKRLCGLIIELKLFCMSYELELSGFVEI